MIEKRVSSRVIPGEDGNDASVGTSLSFTAFVKPSADQLSPRVKIEYSAKRDSLYLKERSNEDLIREMRGMLETWYDRAVTDTGDATAPPLDVFLNVMTKIKILNSGKSKRIMFTVDSRNTTNFIVRIYEIFLLDLGLTKDSIDG